MDIKTNFCSVSGCVKKVHARGFCGSHYQSARIAGLATNCLAEGCKRNSHTRGYCNMHYKRASQGREINAPAPQERGRLTTCLITGCERPYSYRGACTKHGNLLWMTSLTVLQLDHLYATTPACEICKREFPSDRERHIDHDHACCGYSKKQCGQCIRGLLCSPCNLALGNMEDDLDRLSSAIAYLSR